ncbi:MAG: restriction endonuclease subunit S [Fimbriimonadales bacterium]
MSTTTSAAESEPRATQDSSWLLVALADGLVQNVQTGFACGVNNRDGRGIAHIRPMNVSTEGQIELSDMKFVALDEATRDERLVQRGDVIFNNTNSPELVGKTALYDEGEPRAFSNHMTRLRVDESRIRPHYLALALHQLWREGYFADKCNNHVSQASISRAVLLETEIPLPSTEVQKTLVQTVTDLQQQVHSASGRLDTIPSLLKKLRQSVLSAACSGQLTADWRETHSAIPDGRGIVAKLEASHFAAGGHRKGNAAAPSEEAHDLDPLGLPESWGLTDFRNAVDPSRPITYGILKPGPNVVEGIPYVRVADFPGDKLVLGGIKKTSREIEAAFARARLRSDDVLLSIRGTVGRVCVVPVELEGGNITQDTARLSLQTFLLRDYVVLYLKSAPVQDRMDRAQKGVAVRGINIGDVRALQLAVPPWEEQLEIVRRVESLLALAGSIESRLAEATTQVGRTSQAILAKAFRGELATSRRATDPKLLNGMPGHSI